MLKFQLMTEKDKREAAYIERKRMQEEERKKRLFNPRVRLIGIDKDALEAQVQEKKRLEAEKKRIDDIFENELKKADEIAVALEQKEKEEVKKLKKEINEFRKNFQKTEDRREFDLNDPNGMKKQLPCRLHDDDPRLGPSSAQKFEGEDLVSEERLKVQRDQIKAWLSQQLIEKEQAEKERKLAEDAYKAAVIARDHRAIELANIEKNCRRKLEEATTKYNLALAEEKCKSQMTKRQQTLEDNTAEIYNTMMSELLTESPDVAQSNMGPGKKIAYSYKGMSEEEKLQVRKDQMAQAEEARKKKQQEERNQREFDEYINGTQKSVYLMDLEIERKKREERKKIAEENLRLAEEQRNRKKFLDKIVYMNRATDEYFDQFNKSTR
ncbi:RIB43A-like with coiled-coils protein 2 [Anthonomus grandis grandis]|uniref:RIB43A-like with coiled-coils protein 2 n=1 Tax=Anthonomus grandis grandis TaxID=2921223 RepID=UPI002165846C|nr:RIB43A-like with coiled-coils protein 2 [Anthonomus grandis grandis]